MPPLSNILNLAGHILQERVTENRYGQNMISLLDSQLPMMNASQRRAKYAERPSPCQSRAGYLPAAQETHSCCEHFSPSPPVFLPWPLPFLWLYWSVLTTRVCLSRCSIHPCSRRVWSPCSTVPSENRLQSSSNQAAAAVAVWQADLLFFSFFLLWRDCGFWSIHNGRHSLAAIECRCVKIYRKGRVM